MKNPSPTFWGLCNYITVIHACIIKDSFTIAEAILEYVAFVDSMARFHSCKTKHLPLSRFAVFVLINTCIFLVSQRSLKPLPDQIS